MAIVSNPRSIELHDIQGLITRGYGKLLARLYLMVEFTDEAKAREWLTALIPHIDNADHTSTDKRTAHIAFTAKGLSGLGLSDANINNFPIPMRETMNTPNRNRLLGDYGDNAPNSWLWGGNQADLHACVILHAENKESLNAYAVEIKTMIKDSGGVNIIREMPGFAREDGKEPFGFHDGISQPTIKGSGRNGPENDIVATGEFLLGYKNQYELYPYSPLITDPQGDQNWLPADSNDSGYKDLGRNGSFMVFRQIQQFVDKFWEFMEDKTKNPDGTVNEEAKTKLASKCVGRWPSGASLVNHPDKDPGGLPHDDDFGYADLDPKAHRCPFGSHMRRNNPRDAFRWYDKEQSLKITKRHRIMRRGSSYEEFDDRGDMTETGLHFVCFNADFEMQFEFIQHAWANNRQLRHLTNDIDVIIGVPPEENAGQKSQFTVQGEPVNEFVNDIEPFVRIRGGEYFFMPGIAALQYLTTLGVKKG